MAEPVWARSSRPTPDAAAVVLGRWQPVAPADLTTHRRQLAAALHEGGRPATVDEGAVERLLLVFEELVSNGLRHGSAPVVAELTTFDRFWLLDVSDAAGDRSPALAVGRDAAHRVDHFRHRHSSSSMGTVKRYDRATPRYSSEHLARVIKDIASRLRCS